jgi:hypothetical protein
MSATTASPTLIKTITIEVTLENKLTPRRRNGEAVRSLIRAVPIGGVFRLDPPLTYQTVYWQAKRHGMLVQSWKSETNDGIMMKRIR